MATIITMVTIFVITPLFAGAVTLGLLQYEYKSFDLISGPNMLFNYSLGGFFHVTNPNQVQVDPRIFIRTTPECGGVS